MSFSLLSEFILMFPTVRTTLIFLNGVCLLQIASAAVGKSGAIVPRCSVMFDTAGIFPGAILAKPLRFDVLFFYIVFLALAAKSNYSLSFLSKSWTYTVPRRISPNFSGKFMSNLCYFSLSSPTAYWPILSLKFPIYCHFPFESLTLIIILHHFYWHYISDT